MSTTGVISISNSTQQSHVIGKKSSNQINFYLYVKPHQANKLRGDPGESGNFSAVLSHAALKSTFQQTVGRACYLNLAD